MMNNQERRDLNGFLLRKNPVTMKTKINNRFIVTILTIVCILLLGGCEKKEDIIVGFSGCLTGRLSALGISGRDGVLLAVDQINRNQGINGRKVKLIVKDDRQDSKTALRVDRELIEKGAVAVIGHMTSSMSAEATPLFNSERRVLLSPTSTTNDLSGKDDYFLRTGLPDIAQTNQLAAYATTTLNLKKMAGIFDQTNQVFTKGWINNFAEAFQENGGELKPIISFTSAKKTNYRELSENLTRNKPEGVVIVAGSLETALFSQHLKKSFPDLLILTSGWAKTQGLIENGGPAVEGIVLPQSHNPNSTRQTYLSFKKQYQDFYGKIPDFAAAGGYDAAMMLFEALQETTDPNQLKEAILNLKDFNGLQGRIRMDSYGDAIRKTYLVTVKNGQFFTLE
jgi:branched-chain amino acid transport system substrate-binding protein